VPIEGTESPIQAGDIQRYTESRADGVPCHSAAEVRGSHSGGERQPGKWFEFVVDEKGFQTARSGITLGEWWVATIVEDSREELIVVLVKTVEPCLKVVPRNVGAETNLSSCQELGLTSSGMP
jgi:hypothetical protein